METLWIFFDTIDPHDINHKISFDTLPISAWKEKNLRNIV